MSSRVALAIENLESRLNLSTLGGLSLPPSVDVPIRAEERLTIEATPVRSLIDVVGQGTASSENGAVAGDVA